ncbi:hypothetical protein CC78DRAFT_20997 [Lojkania enalia]|uniref:Secreted protein n=1 Tax=Lojkania enalia TaxID=147567 RepID=A0A9P4N6F6_9PLEO|nr:hypothetical protein CC78DRAFT_20997 [Didymosphaeria enalia]
MQGGGGEGDGERLLLLACHLLFGRAGLWLSNTSTTTIADRPTPPRRKTRTAQQSPRPLSFPLPPTTLPCPALPCPLLASYVAFFLRERPPLRLHRCCFLSPPTFDG